MKRSRIQKYISFYFIRFIDGLQRVICLLTQILKKLYLPIFFILNQKIKRKQALAFKIKQPPANFNVLMSPIKGKPK